MPSMFPSLSRNQAALSPEPFARIIARHFGDAIDRLQPRQIDLLENHAAPEQLGDRGDDVIDREAHLGEGAR
jgi:hypothetical protein